MKLNKTLVVIHVFGKNSIYLLSYKHSKFIKYLTKYIIMYGCMLDFTKFLFVKFGL